MCVVSFHKLFVFLGLLHDIVDYTLLIIEKVLWIVKVLFIFSMLVYILLRLDCQYLCRIKSNNIYLPLVSISEISLSTLFTHSINPLFCLTSINKLDNSLLYDCALFIRKSIVYSQH